MFLPWPPPKGEAEVVGEMPSGLVDRPEELTGMVVEAATVVVEAAKVLVVEAGEKAEAAPKLRPVTKINTNFT